MLAAPDRLLGHTLLCNSLPVASSVMANKFPVEDMSAAISRAAVKLGYSQLQVKQYVVVSEFVRGQLRRLR